MNFGCWAPVVPAAPAKQTDRAWVADYQRRHAAAGSRSANAGLSRAWTASADSGQRRQVNRGTARQLAAEAREDAALAAYRRDQGEVRAMISRMRMKRSAPAGVVSRSAAALGECRHCRDCNFTPAESAKVHQGWDALTGAGHRNYDPR